LKSVFVVEKTIDSMWFRLLSEVYKKGRKNHIDNGSFAGSDRLEFDFVAGTIEYPTTRPLAPIMPTGVPPVTTDEEIEKYFINYLMDGTLEGNEHYKYATWISGGEYKLPKCSGYSLYGIDEKGTQKKEIYLDLVMNVPNQVEWIINHYKQKGHGNNHCYIQVGYPESSFAYDMTYKNENERQTSPCLRGIDTHIKDGKLCFAVVFRSWDLFAGFPENMGGITMLMEYMANELEVKVGTLSFSSLKLHCYDFQIDVLKARLGL
jgi:thymidylate synthase